MGVNAYVWRGPRLIRPAAKYFDSKPGHAPRYRIIRGRYSTCSGYAIAAGTFPSRFTALNTSPRRNRTSRALYPREEIRAARDASAEIPINIPVFSPCTFFLVVVRQPTRDSDISRHIRGCTRSRALHRALGDARGVGQKKDFLSLCVTRYTRDNTIPLPPCDVTT